MRDTRRLLLVLLAGLFVSGAAALWVARAAPKASANDSPATGTGRLITVTSIIRLPDTPDGLQPVTPPSDPYAPEEIKRLGTIEIPRIGLTSPIYHGITLHNIDLGPSHWPGTAYPGQVGNAVFAGHRVTHTHPFREIDQLAEGDEVIFTVDGVRSVYKVIGHEVVAPSALRITAQTPTATATLFACHPPHSASFRYVVHLALESVSGP